MQRLIRVMIVVAALALSVTAPGRADSRDPVIGQVEMYLENLTTLKADFVQIAPSGELASGQFFLKRPDKMRWQYDPPVPVLMVSTRDYLRYYDYELDQISDIPLDDTLAGFLARQDVRFDPTVVKVLDAASENGVLRIKIAQAGKPGDGTLTMEFTESPLRLRNLIVVDVEGKQTNISLNNAEYGVKLPDDLFVIKDTRLGGKSRR